MTEYTPEIAVNTHCLLGEGPLWHPERGLLYWTDITAGRLHSFDPAGGEVRTIYQGEAVGGFSFQADGSLLLFQIDKISRFVEGEGSTVLIEGIDSGMERFNDVIADPRGRVFAGTIGKTPELGGLYRVDPDGTVTCLIKGTRCSNGMAFTADLRSFYWTDTTQKAIYRFDYEIETGEISNRHELILFDPNGGSPDGLTIDTEGCLWSARWGGSGVFRFSPQGELIEKVEIPVAKTSCPIFGGPDLSDLYVTTAGGVPEEKTLDGAVFRIRTPYQGSPEFKSRVLL